MPTRAYWRGHLKLSLVTCSVALYPASSSSKRLSFHRINKATGNPLKQLMVDPHEHGPELDELRMDLGESQAAVARSDRNPGKSQLTQDPGRAAAVVGGPKHPGPGRPAEDDAQRRPDPLTNAVSSYGPVPVSKQQVGRGYELTDGHLLEVTDEELRSVEIESSHTIEIDTFVPEQEIDKRYLQTPYYVAPTDRVGQEAFGVIRDAIKGANLAALGRVVLGRRERVIMLEPFERGLLGVTLRFPYEIRDPPPSLGTIADLDVPQEVHALAQHIVQSKTGQLRA